MQKSSRHSVLKTSRPVNAHVMSTLKNSEARARNFYSGTRQWYFRTNKNQRKIFLVIRWLQWFQEIFRSYNIFNDFSVLIWYLTTQGSSEGFNHHRCQLGSNDDFLIRNDHWCPDMLIITFEVGEVANVDTAKSIKQDLVVIMKQFKIQSCSWRQSLISNIFFYFISKSL